MSSSSGKPEWLYSKQNPTGVRVTGVRGGLFSDLYYFFMQASWWKLLTLVVAAFLAFNLLFAFAYLQAGGVKGVRADSFVDLFFFSVQTMCTIGYGAMFPATTVANLLVTIEALLGILSTAVMTGLAFAKFSRPRARILFSQHVVIAQRDGQPTLMVRVANERSNHVAEAQMRMAVLRDEVTLEGEAVRRIHDLHLVRGQTPAFTLTWTGLHVVDDHSPLHGMTYEQLQTAHVHLIVTIIGHDETFASTIHARHVYSSDQFVWNKRFADLMLAGPHGERIVDYSRFNDLVDMPPVTPQSRAA